MKKLVLALVVVAAGAAAAVVGYQYWQKAQGGRDADLLAYVPADTLFFVGNAEPFPLREVVARFQGSAQPNQAQLEQIQAEVADAPDGGKLLIALYVALSQAAASEQGVAELGLGEKYQSAFYTVAAAPVLRVQLADAAGFLALLDGIEQKQALRPERSTFEGVEQRSYELIPANGKNDRVDLTVAVHEQVATLFVDSEMLGGDEVRRQALGLAAPEQSLAQSGQLEQLMKQHGFLPVALGYVSHRELVRGIVDPQANGLSRLLSRAAAEDDSGQWDWLETARSEGCRADFLALADTWPRTTLGYTRFDLGSPAQLEMRLIVESTDAELMQLLASLRGHIPALGSAGEEAPLMAFGVGIDVAALPRVMQGVWNRLTQAQFRCAPLQEMQRQAQQNDPAMAAAMTAMLSTLKGGSLVIYDMEMQDGAPDLANASMLVALAAENPSLLLTMASGLQPGLASLQVPEDGTAVPLPVPPQQGMQPMIAIRNKHLVAFAGDQAEARAAALSSETLEPNGVLAFSMDYSKYGKLVLSMMESGPMAYDPQMQEVRQMFEDFAATEGSGGAKLDFTPAGIVITGEASVR